MESNGGILVTRNLEEAKIRALRREKVRERCAEEIKGRWIRALPRLMIEFALCAQGKTFSMPFQCREHNLAMNACFKKAYAARRVAN